MHAQWHRHSAAHTIVVLEGHLQVNETVVGPGSYCHFPANTPMLHAPAGDGGCLFVILFDGPFDVAEIDPTGAVRDGGAFTTPSNGAGDCQPVPT